MKSCSRTYFRTDNLGTESFLWWHQVKPCRESVSEGPDASRRLPAEASTISPPSVSPVRWHLGIPLSGPIKGPTSSEASATSAVEKTSAGSTNNYRLWEEASCFTVAGLWDSPLVDVLHRSTDPPTNYNSVSANSTQPVGCPNTVERRGKARLCVLIAKPSGAARFTTGLVTLKPNGQLKKSDSTCSFFPSRCCDIIPQ